MVITPFAPLTASPTCPSAEPLWELADEPDDEMESSWRSMGESMSRFWNGGCDGERTLPREMLEAMLDAAALGGVTAFVWSADGGVQGFVEATGVVSREMGIFCWCLIMEGSSCETESGEDEEMPRCGECWDTKACWAESRRSEVEGEDCMFLVRRDGDGEVKSGSEETGACARVLVGTESVK